MKGDFKKIICILFITFLTFLTIDINKFFVCPLIITVAYCSAYARGENYLLGWEKVRKVGKRVRR